MNNWTYLLRSGHSDDPSQGACAMDAVNWLVHGKHGDRPECACPVVAGFVIGGNDAMPDDVRQRLIPYLHRIAGSKSNTHEAARLRVIVLGAVRLFTPLALNAAGMCGEADELRHLPDGVSYTDAASAADTAASAAYAAATSAAYAAAASAAYATSYAATSAAYAANATAAYAAANAARFAADAERFAAAYAARTWDAYFTVLDDALTAGPQGEPWSADVLETGLERYRLAGGLVTA